MCWTFETGGPIRSSPTVVDETVLVGSRDNSLHAIDCNTGNSLWRFDTEADVDSSPAVTESTALIGSSTGTVHALALSDGTQQWQFDTGGPVQSSPTVSEGLILVGSDDEMVYALDETGESEWTFQTSGFVRTSPTAVDGTAVVGSSDGYVYGIATETGEQRWRHRTSGGAVRSSATRSGSLAIVGDFDGQVFALDAAEGSETWAFATSGSVWSSPTVWSQTVFVGDREGYVYAADSESGSLRWRTNLGQGVLSSPTVVDGTVLVGTDDGFLYALDATTGDPVWRFGTDDRIRSSPTVVDRVLFVGSYDGTLYALDIGIDGSSDDSRVQLGTLGQRVRSNEISITPSTMAVEIVDTTTPVEAGEHLNVTADVTQAGNQTATERVELDADALGSDAVPLDIENGETVSVSLSVDTAVGDEGTHTAVVRCGGASDSTQVDVRAPPSFEVDIYDFEDTVEAGHEVALDVRVSNAGGLSETQTVQIESVLFGTEQFEVTLDGGQSHVESIPLKIPPDATGEYRITATSDDSTTTVTATVDDPTERIVETSPVPETIPTIAHASLSYDALEKVDPLGSGGNADVYYAKTTSSDAPSELALKEPRMSGTLHTEVVERMLQEAETWQRLDGHDHIVGVVDYGAEPLPWIAVEYMDAGGLDQRAGELSLDQALWTAVAVTKAVRHAHRRGVAHLDLKPENILFRRVEDAWDVPKVADWGLSKHLLEHSKSVEGMTVEYAAPEQFDDDYGAADDITDVYQLGAVFYELFTGRPPFEGKPFKVMNKIQHEEPDPPSAVADVPAELDDILLRALATEKSERYETVIYLRDDLQELFDKG